MIKSNSKKAASVKDEIGRTANEYRRNELQSKPSASLTTNGIMIASMTRADLTFIIEDGKVTGTYWANTSEGLWADTRKALSNGELARMKAMPWGSDDRLDWLLEITQNSGLSLDMLEDVTRFLFGPSENGIAQEIAA